MSLFTDIANGAGKLTHEAKKSYGAKILEMRIKNYHKEENELYTKLGKMLYQVHREAVTDDRFTAEYDNIDAIKARVKHLEQQLSDIRNLPGPMSEDTPPTNYIRLDRKESDLTITRTNEGIRLIRMCPECHAPNSPNDTECPQCRHVFG